MNALDNILQKDEDGIELSPIECAIFWVQDDGTKDALKFAENAAAELAEKDAELAALRQVVEAARKVLPYLENCARHHRDDSILEDEIIPAIESALARVDGEK